MRLVGKMDFCTPKSQKHQSRVWKAHCRLIQQGWVLLLPFRVQRREIHCALMGWPGQDDRMGGRCGYPGYPAGSNRATRHLFLVRPQACEAQRVTGRGRFSLLTPAWGSWPPFSSPKKPLPRISSFSVPWDNGYKSPRISYQ